MTTNWSWRPRECNPLRPAAALAEAAGDPDPERWWDDVIEHRGDGTPAFDAVAEAMTAVRGGARGIDGSRGATRSAHASGAPQGDRRWARADRGRVRRVARAGVGRAAADRRRPTPARCRGMPKVKVGLCWVPWTHRRLAAATGYGAGVRSPGWYAHVFKHPGEPGISRWFVGAARLLRDRGMSASPDDLIAATRARHHIGCAAQSSAAGAGRGARCRRHGDGRRQRHDADQPRADRRRRRSARCPTMRRRCRWPATSPRNSARVRLKPAATAQTVELDVRAPNGRARSRLLHRLRALGVHLGHGGGGTGQQRHVPRDVAVVVGAGADDPGDRVVGARHHGAGRGCASPARAGRRRSRRSADLVAVLDTALLADLPDVVQPVVALVEAQAAHDPDVGAGRSTRSVRSLGHLRYGDVRGTDASALRARVRRAGRARRGRSRHGMPLARRRCRGGDGRAAGRCAGCAGAGRSSRRAAPSGRPC